MNFRLDPFFNRHLAPGADRVDVVLSIASDASLSSAAPPVRQAVVGIIVDMSGSMQGEREEAARIAVRRAVSLLDESVQFFIVSFASRALLIFGPAAATSQNKAIADEATRRLTAGGGTFMSSALNLAHQIFAGADGIKYALFLTDGKNAAEDESEFNAELNKCEGAFQCDCRGVGTDWSPNQLRKIAEKLLGTAEIIPTPAQMEADFHHAIRGALDRTIGDVRLRLWTPKAVSVVGCKQVSPRIEDLIARGTQVDAQTIDYPTGAWSSESRDYYLAFSLPPNQDGDEMLACRPSLVYGRGASETRITCGNVVVDWTSDDQLSARIDEHVAHYTGQQELAEAIEEGLRARESGNVDVATSALGRAAKIAAQSGNEETTKRLAKVVDIVDAEHGTVRLKAAVSKADAMDLDLGSTKTSRVKRS